MERRTLFIAAAALSLLLITAAFLLLTKKSDDSQQASEAKGVEGDPIDVVLDFYEDWISIRNTASGNDATDRIHASQMMSEALKQKLISFNNTSENNLSDLTHCHSQMPKRMRTKIILQNAGATQILMNDADLQSNNQAVISLIQNNAGRWLVTDVSCSQGETSPHRGTFSFDNEGQLLKNSLPEQFSTEQWHLVYSQDGLDGFTAPLFISQETQCTDTNDETITCDVANWFETMSVHVQGTMTESGVEVANIKMR